MTSFLTRGALAGTFTPSRFLSVCLRTTMVALVAILLLSGRAAHAQEPAVDDVVVANSATHLLLYCAVNNGFTAEMEKGLHNGIPITFTFFVRLEQLRSMLPGRGVASFSFDQTLLYDNLKEEYRVTVGVGSGKTVTAKTLKEAKRLMAEVNGMKVVPLARLVPDAEYVLSVKARLDKKTLPLNFHYLVPFWHLWDFETQWNTVRFRY